MEGEYGIEFTECDWKRVNGPPWLEYITTWRPNIAQAALTCSDGCASPVMVRVITGSGDVIVSTTTFVQIKVMFRLKYEARSVKIYERTAIEVLKNQLYCMISGSNRLKTLID